MDLAGCCKDLQPSAFQTNLTHLLFIILIREEAVPVILSRGRINL